MVPSEPCGEAAASGGECNPERFKLQLLRRILAHSAGNPAYLLGRQFGRTTWDRFASQRGLPTVDKSGQPAKDHAGIEPKRGGHITD